MINKKDIKEQLIAHQEKLINDLNTMLSHYKEGADLDEQDTHDPEDFSHQGEWSKASFDLTQRVKHAQDELELLKSIPLEPSDTVGQGSVVITDNMAFVIGAAIPPFTYLDKKIVGISTRAPIYAMMRGKEKGDTFTFGKVVYSIHDVL